MFGKTKQIIPTIFGKNSNQQNNQDSPHKDSNNPQNQQDKQNSAKDGNDFAKILLEISEQEQANEYANTNTTATQERTYFNANGRGLGRLETSHTPSTQQPQTISIPRIRDSSTHNGSSSEIFTAASRQGRATSRRSGSISRRSGAILQGSQELADTDAESKAIYQEADGFTTAEANELFRLQTRLEKFKAIEQEFKKQQGIKTYKEVQNLETTKTKGQILDIKDQQIEQTNTSSPQESKNANNSTSQKQEKAKTRGR